jgi:hypothetical protein
MCMYSCVHVHVLTCMSFITGSSCPPIVGLLLSLMEGWPVCQCLCFCLVIFWGVPSLVFIVALRCVGCCRPLGAPPPVRPDIGSVAPFCSSGGFCGHPAFERLSVLMRRRFLTKTNAILIRDISVAKREIVFGN